MYKFNKDIEILERKLKKIPKNWDGKQSILELKEADYNWRQMEWWAFYFEYQVKKVLNEFFQFPGDRYGPVEFDLKGNINWDLKPTALNTDSDIIASIPEVKTLNELLQSQMFFGILLVAGIATYGDEDRTFRNWHEQLGAVKYPKTQSPFYKYNITKYQVINFTFCVITSRNIKYLDIIQNEYKHTSYCITYNNIDKLKPFIMYYETN